ncbi:hypothetical protein OF83DRAFT_1169551 [Amylostereum chailletii]|nr:hypothetical protein OF83DRAFT_1169551 [Amylostereum chailletii]
MPSPPRLPFSLIDGLIPGPNRGNLWFDDGSLILLVNATAFKVYAGLLTRESNVFAQLLSSPQWSIMLKNPVIVENCPVLDLHHEPPVEELTQALQYIHTGAGVELPAHDDFPALTRVLTLAGAYELKRLYVTTLRIIRQHYASRLRSYAEWDGISGFTRPSNPVHALNFVHNTLEIEEKPCMGSADTRAGLMLVGVLARIDLSLYVSEADALAAREPRRASPYAPGLESDEDEDTCNRLRQYHKEFSSALVKVLGEFHTIDESYCCNFQKMYRHLREVMGSFRTKIEGRYFLDLLHAVRTDSDRRLYCEGCLRKLDETVMLLYQHWWDGLPHTMGLQNWDNLGLGAGSHAWMDSSVQH